MSESNPPADRVELAPTCAGTAKIGAAPVTEKPLGCVRRKFSQIGHWAVTAPLWLRAVLLLIAVGGFLLTGFAWSLASPPGGSPDDDYHLASIWCPRPLERSGCPIKTIDGKPAVEIPARFTHLTCFIKKPKVSAACSENFDGEKAFTNRVDRGDYPWGYYQLQHLLVGKNMEVSVVAMRMCNVTLAVLLLGTILLLAPPRFRPWYFFALVGAWVPMGIYFIASNNPSSWALIGVAGYGLGLHAAAFSEPSREVFPAAKPERVPVSLRWRQIVLVVLSALGCLMAMASRADAAFYIFVVSLSIWMLIPRHPHRRWLLIFSIIVSVLGLIVTATSGQNAALSDSGDNHRELPSFLGKMFGLIMSLPRFFFGLWGAGWGPGWFDVNLRPEGIFPSAIAVGVLISLGLSAITARKFWGIFFSLGALLGIPFVVMFLQNYSDINRYQPRYMLPLLVIVLVIWLLPPVCKEPDQPAHKFATSTLRYEIFVLLFMCWANLQSLFAVVGRYVRGETWKGGVDLNSRISWWWDFSAPLPLQTWIIGALSFIFAVFATLWLVHVSPAHRGGFTETNSGELEVSHA